MKPKVNCFVAGILLLLIQPNPLLSKETEKQKPLKFKDYHTVQWISYRGYTPIKIMRLDNNSDIILACRYGKTREQLKQMGIEVIESQLKLLQIFKLISIKDGLIKTTFPILEPRLTGQMRSQSKKWARDLEKLIRPDVLKLLGILKSLGREKNAYPIVFAYVLDGMIWKDFKVADLVHSLKITTEKPFWAGEIWSYYPPRDFRSGTNTFQRGKYALKQNWNATANPMLKPFYREFLKLDKKIVGQILDKGLVHDPEVRKTFAKFGMCDDTGQLLIPVIKEEKNNKLYQLSRHISKTLADQVTAIVPLEQLKEKYEFRDIQQALVVVYHEIMWDLMEELKKNTGIKIPLFCKSQ